MIEMTISNWMTILMSLIFWLSPVALTIHLAVNRNKPNAYKTKVGYIYGGLWAIALIYYFGIFLK